MNKKTTGTDSPSRFRLSKKLRFHFCESKNKVKLILRRGAPQGGFSCPFGAIHLLYLAQNTSQAASVRFARAQQTANVCRKRPQTFFDMLSRDGESVPAFVSGATFRGGRALLFLPHNGQGGGEVFRVIAAAALEADPAIVACGCQGAEEGAIIRSVLR